jgi:hypothetical protein
MTRTVKPINAGFILLLMASPAFAGPCAQSIATTQRDIDSAIERSAGTGGWKTEGLGAMRGHQPTPRSLAAAEGSNDADFIAALDSLERARAADNAGDAAVCKLELANARAALR